MHRQILKIALLSDFYWLKNSKPVQIHRELCEVYGEKVISRQEIEKLCYMVKYGTDVTSDYRVGRPSRSKTTDNIVLVNEIIRTNRRIIIDKIAGTLDIYFGNAQQIQGNCQKELCCSMTMQLHIQQRLRRLPRTRVTWNINTVVHIILK